MTVISLDDYRPHTLIVIDGKSHIIPQLLIEDIAAGRASIAEVGETEDFGRCLAILALERLNER